MLRLAALVLLSAALAVPEARGEASATAPSAADPVHLRYRVSWSLIPLLEIESRTRLDPAGYVMEVRMATVGLMDLVFQWRASQEVRGAVSQETVAPQSFKSESEFRGRRQEVDLGYGPEGLDRERVEGSIVDAGERDEVPKELRRDTVDPLTAVVAVSRRIVDRGTCAGTARIFDGVRRYDLSYEDLGERQLEDAEDFTGRARLCRATMTPLGGFWRPPDREPDSLGHIDAWWAPPWPGADPVPVKLSLEGSRGTMDVQLVTATRGDAGSGGS